MAADAVWHMQMDERTEPCSLNHLQPIRSIERLCHVVTVHQLRMAAPSSSEPPSR